MITNLAEYITALGVITTSFSVVISKIFDIKLKPLTNRDRMQLRFQIVSFASDLHRGIPHTRDEYLSIFELITEYESICKQLDIKNHVFEEECKYIDACFQSLDILNTGRKN